jgi:FixJ family two-component response regulator
MANGFLLPPAILSFQGEFSVARNLIAVVDDDESIRTTTKLLIESFGLRAEVFESAESYLSSGRVADTTCLLVDVRMPGINGLELQRRLAASGSKVPVIFITAFDDDESRGRAIRAGAAAFLSKPFSGEQLLQTIRAAIKDESKLPILILIVDDDESIRRTTRLLIESFGFLALVFESAKDVLGFDELGRASCLIVDVQMPGMDGLELQSQLAAMGRSIPIIFITAYDSNESRRRAMRAGAVAFLSKPFNDEQLLQSVRSALSLNNGSTKSAG